VLGVWGGLYFLFAAVAVISIARWYLQNETQSPNKPTLGLFAMLDRKQQKLPKPWTPKGPN
jgi:hypothetical protein